MIIEAIKKIKDEMSKNNNPYVQVIGDFLIKHLESNPGVAEKILDNEKAIIKSLDEMQKEARKKKVGNCAVLTDQEGFEIVLKYFGIDGVVLAAKGVATQMSKPVVAHEKRRGINFEVNLQDLLK